ncbi:MAG: LamG-like jellyroll fold domain-containing protein, partial [Thermoguttaceae bacterium]
MKFDGASDYAVVEDGSLFDMDAFTLAARVKLDKTAGSQIILTRGEAGKLFTLYIYNGTVRMLVEYGADQYTHANVPVPPAGKWVHLAGTYDGQVIRLYVDGKLEAETKAVGRIPKSDAPLMIGAVAPGSRVLAGELDRVCVCREALDAQSVAGLAAGTVPGPDVMVGCWAAGSAEGQVWKSAIAGGVDAARKTGGILICRKETGYRGIWYFNQPQGDEYVYKYSGGMGTYCAKHRPFAVYAPEVNKTFFCYGGTQGEGSQRTLVHMVSYYDHNTGMVPRPTLLLDKHTDDAHDNPVISMDDKGFIWIFSSSHGTGRPSYISVSKQPYSVDEFELVQVTNFSYTQPYYLKGQGFFFLHTRYGQGGRRMFLMTSPDGRTWSEGEKLAMIEMGHYQVSWPCGNRKVGTAFDMHPAPDGLNWRTNLYYMETDDFGKTWRNVQGEKLHLPLTAVENPALVHDYRREDRKVYVKDVAYDSEDRPVVLYITSGG